jgi:hypothetical protein
MSLAEKNREGANIVTQKNGVRSIWRTPEALFARVPGGKTGNESGNIFG